MTILHLDVPAVKPGSEVSRPRDRGEHGANTGEASASPPDTQAAEQPAANTSGDPESAGNPTNVECRTVGMTQSSRLITAQLHLRGGHAPV